MAIIDIGLTNDGDLFLRQDPNTLEKDISVAVNEDVMRQQVMMRLNTYKGDWLTYPLLGANMADYIGTPNTRENGERIAAKIKNALTYDGFMKESAIEVYSIPVNEDEILFTIRATYGSTTMTFPVAYSLKEGMQEGGTWS